MKNKIIDILKAKKWTQTRLAKEIGVTSTRINNWYKGYNEPKELWIIDKINKLHNECMKKPLLFM